VARNWSLIGANRKREILQVVTAVLGWICVLVTLMYYAFGGYKKLLLLGTSIDSAVFRIMGFDDTNRVVTAFFELARRVLMPFVLVCRIGLHNTEAPVSRATTALFVAIAVISSIVNLDRGPVFLYIVLFFFVYYFNTKHSLAKLVLTSSILVASIGLVGAILTFLQYNHIDLDRQMVLGTIKPILLDRALLDPVRAGESLVFNNGYLLDNPLYLRCSRLGALVGRQYVGTEDAYSEFVAPVGLIADVYRNFGLFGLPFIAAVHGAGFIALNRRLSRVDYNVRVPVMFLTLAFVMYLFFSGLFSQGPFALLVGIVLATTLFGSRERF